MNVQCSHAMHSHSQRQHSKTDLAGYVQGEEGAGSAAGGSDGLDGLGECDYDVIVNTPALMCFLFELYAFYAISRTQVASGRRTEPKSACR